MWLGTGMVRFLLVLCWKRKVLSRDGEVWYRTSVSREVTVMRSVDSIVVCRRGLVEWRFVSDTHSTTQLCCGLELSSHVWYWLRHEMHSSGTA